MKIKIDAPMAWGAEHMGKLVTYADETPLIGDVPVRIIRESDWRKIMAVLKAADNATDPDGNWLYPQATLIGDEVVALRKYLEKRREKAQ